ncbi:ribosomal-processing cysteine protease Prp [Aerococcus kribbianus]|uniref:Ribosomal processing cysteine protease Prp n=1 Tax=Aerococcus kribbianus TaxID=2999064 RepID=A0A9X3FN65_9LACT|nr:MULTISPECIES: ribosomal-processing cysteine protease Prp [unclassified Aerococcus]MCZ0716686.1 ribosomal-processing cysteine protease Prp [Aerococcus sp. YH-aer221]MCZ0724974.1 ribosomal-processing cysteine protease Prp [Aerococcus sp. YH-aer222]
MISAVFKANITKEIIALEISGHAMSGPHGYDIVCAGVSAVVISTVNNLSRLGKIDPILETDDREGGYLYLELPDDLSDQQIALSQMLLQACYYALKDDIQTEYPQSLRVSLA